MTLAIEYLTRFPFSPYQAYLEMQRALMRRFVARGGSEEEFVARLAGAFRTYFGWMLDVPAGHYA